MYTYLYKCFGIDDTLDAWIANLDVPIVQEAVDHTQLARELQAEFACKRLNR